MLMLNGNRLYILLGFLSLVFVAEAFNLDFDFWNQDEEEPTEAPVEAAETQDDPDSTVAPGIKSRQNNGATEDETVNEALDGFFPPQEAFFPQETVDEPRQEPLSLQETEPGFFPPQAAFQEPLDQPQEPVDQPQEAPEQEFFPPQNAFFPAPVQESPQETVHTYPAVDVDPVKPVKVESVMMQEEVEQVVYELDMVPFDIRKIKFMSTTETVTLTATSYFRSTVIITPTLYKTDTMLMQTSVVVTDVHLTTAETTVTETQILVKTVTRPQTLFKTVRTPVIMYLTVEGQTTETVLQPYTLTTTRRNIETVWITNTLDLSNENNIRIPVVEIATTTTTIPYHSTREVWITRTETTTVCQDW